MDLNYNGDPFTINIEIWLPRSFPFQAPLFFIVPSGSQRLRPSAIVDQTGRVNHTYLTYWHTRPNSTLIEMMNYLHPAFCQDPPIFLEQKRPVPPPQPILRAPAASSVPSPAVPQLSLAQLKEELERKLLARYQTLQTELATDTDRILAENTALDQGEAKINKAITRLREEILAVQEETQQMTAKCASIEEMIIQLRSSGTLDVDKLVIPHGPVSKQIMGELAKELAAQDCLYALSNALEKGSIDLTAYLRLVREQAKKEFMAKALLRKIREMYPQ